MSLQLRRWVLRHPPWWSAVVATAAAVVPCATLVFAAGPAHFASGFGVAVSLTVPAVVAAVGGWSAATLTHALDLARLDAHRAGGTDPLTNALTRASLLTTLARDIGVVRRAEGAYSLVVLDIGDLDGVRARHGDAAADSARVAIAELCQGGLRSTDLFARWGDDQFLIALPGTGAAGARDVAERLRDGAASMMIATVSRSSFKVPVSVGVATWGNGADSIDRFTRRADEAMMRARAGGPNIVCVAEEEAAA